MNIIDTYPAILTAYDGMTFSFERWKKYIDSVLPDIFPILVSDVQKSLKPEQHLGTKTICLC